MRYRIEVDVNKPILAGFFLERRERQPTWIGLKYEKLPNICYKCGVLNHETRSCTNMTEKQGPDFGAWLKAEDRSEFLLQWRENRALDDGLVDPMTQTPMSIDSVTYNKENDKEERLFQGIGKSAMETGEEWSTIQDNSQVKITRFQEEGDLGSGALKQVVKVCGSGLMDRRKEIERMGRINGPGNITGTNKKMAQMKRRSEGSLEEGWIAGKRKRLGGESVRDLANGRMETEEEVQERVDVCNQNTEVEAECAEHLRRKQ